jgi:FMN phosphatase YigB (HAD superfamily)
MIKTIIFDCWGTLFTNSQSPHPFVKFADAFGFSLTDRTFAKVFERHLMQDSHNDLLTGSIPLCLVERRS